VFLNAKIVGSEDILLLLVAHMVLNVKNVMVPIKLNIIGKWYGTIF